MNIIDKVQLTDNQEFTTSDCLAIAEKGLKHTRKLAIFSHNNPWRGNPQGDEEQLREKVIKAHANHQYFLDQLEWKERNECLSLFDRGLFVAKHTRLRKEGPCEKMCWELFFYLYERVDPRITIEMKAAEDIDHCFITIGNCVVLDPWADDYYIIDQLKEKIYGLEFDHTFENLRTHKVFLSPYSDIETITTQIMTPSHLALKIKPLSTSHKYLESDIEPLKKMLHQINTTAENRTHLGQDIIKQISSLIMLYRQEAELTFLFNNIQKQTQYLIDIESGKSRYHPSKKHPNFKPFTLSHN